MSNFCHNAFLGLNISPNGQLKPCCKFLTSEMPPFHISKGIDRYKNSEWLRDIQKQFLDGKKPSGCERCWKEEAAGVKSKRQLDFERHKNKFESMDLDNSNFLNINLAFGNLCNLACRICSPEVSSKWASEKKKEDGAHYPIWDWFKNPNIMNDIWNHTEQAIHIDIPGGEPLLLEIPEHFTYLEKFVKTKRANEISLHYTTNGTTFPTAEHIKIWQSFREIDIQMSIDDIGPRFEYNRWPANWNQVYENIKKYQQLSKSNTNIRLSISYSISALTIIYIDNFFKWCIRENLPAPWMGLVSFHLIIILRSFLKRFEKRYLTY